MPLSVKTNQHETLPPPPLLHIRTVPPITMSHYDEGEIYGEHFRFWDIELFSSIRPPISEEIHSILAACR